MKSLPILLALLVGAVLGGLCLAAASPAQAADLSTHRARTAMVATQRGAVPPFPRSERSQSVWASDACWSGCQSYCTWDEAACFRVDEQGNCLMRTDHCDRICQRQCRTMGGPLVPDIFDF